jgi:hypothetical protein
MRPRFAAIACALFAVSYGALSALPAPAGAHPLRDRGLTIAATPNPISSGEGVLIFGQLHGPTSAHQPIYLYHRVARQRRFTFVGRTYTTAQGFYEFVRAEGVVISNRAWFVRGPHGAHSRTITEHVSALVTAQASATSALTRQAVMFTGTVSPAHRFGRVLLQEQRAAAGNGWRTLRAARTNGASAFAFAYRWRVPGVYTLRVLVPGNPVNIASFSDQIVVVVAQRQVSGFTITTSQPIISQGSTATISGVLDQPGTTTPQPNTEVTLLARGPYGRRHALASTVTATNGSYSFTVTPTTNEVYQVRTTLSPHRHSALLWEGVSDVVTISASPTSAQIGQPISFTGTVLPDKAGHLIFLQRLDGAGHWVNVGVHLLSGQSAYRFSRDLGRPGTYAFRVRIYGGPVNVGGASAPVQVTITDAVAPVSTLPAASKAVACTTTSPTRSPPTSTASRSRRSSPPPHSPTP